MVVYLEIVSLAHDTFNTAESRREVRTTSIYEYLILFVSIFFFEQQLIYLIKGPVHGRVII